MFKKLLIANRGEVAVRIASTARRLGVAPVGIASTADLGSSWLAAMDEVVTVGPSAARESYLQRERIVQAALQTHASAVHPGWGFLAEDPLFAALCEQHAVTFVGPSAAVMAKMGLKSPARAAMKAAGLPVIPGSDGLLRDVDEAAVLAREVGYPVILKADAGGGGRGMRRANDERELRDAFAQASAEARSAFGNGALYLEKYLEGGRHIEVQVLGDRFGHAVHLFERECSIQRKHQKLLEESPSPALSEDERRELGERAASAAQRLGYAGAGTIEFFRASEAQGGQLYFMEMNTRLQVEHPVTEMLCGVDLVELQLRVAANEALPFDQAGVRASGHAIEVRINAEDPARDFRPAPGALENFHVPTDLGPGRVRFDTHLALHEKISPHYDSSIGKLIAHAPTRDAAIETLLRALRGSRIEGVATTIPLQIAVLESAEFRAGRYDTRTIPGWPARA
ncbi:MAG TPA: biotin carboxylase N-terminal domain-containing protein [Planctomycetota bacterium]|nr:biotin carboxylase N-terminal domain-containing protein [Planctomycetota bacterium]